MLAPLCRIEMLGELKVQVGPRTITRFATSKAATLIAYLVFYRQRAHPREELMELLWPEGDPAAGRLSLRVALSSLRRQLEPPGVPSGAIIQADRINVRLCQDAVVTDVSEFEDALRLVSGAADPEVRMNVLQQAITLYRGELLPGSYEDWACGERERLAQRYQGALRQLAALQEESGASEQALDSALRAIQADPLDEESQRMVMNLYAAVGKPEAALRHYQDLGRILQEEFGAGPAAATQALADGIRRSPAIHDLERLPTLGLPEPESVPDERTILPLPFTRFFGREQEMASVQGMLHCAGTRLVTLTGLGGSGKTRLSLEIARREAELGRMVWFVPLADVSDPRLVPGVILQAMRLPRDASQEPIGQILSALKDKSALLVLDNWEQLIEEGAPLLAVLMEQAPSLSLLVTSRQPLGIGGERELPVLSLSLPAPGDDAAHLSTCASACLFVDRAQAVRPDFQVTTRNAEAVAEICRRLDGLPLALELAATWVRSLTPAQMVERLAHRFDLLVSKRRDLPLRHQTLRAAIAWSYQMLPPAVQGFFVGLAVFRGGWTLAAAQAVCEEPQALQYLTNLREWSLVVAEESGNEMRFRLLESLREFGWEQLLPEERTRLEQRHAAWYLAFAEAGQESLGGADPESCLPVLVAEQENLHAVLDWYERQPDQSTQIDLRLRLCAALVPFWCLRGMVVEWRRHLELALLHSDGASPSARADALHASGHLAEYQNEIALAILRYQESLALSRELEDRKRMAGTLLCLGPLLEIQDGLPAARVALMECISLRRALGDRPGTAQVLTALADALLHQGETAKATALYEESLALFQTAGGKSSVERVLRRLGQVAFLRGDYAQARSVYERSLTSLRVEGDPLSLANCLARLGDIAGEQWLLETAQRNYEESLHYCLAAGYKAGAALQRENLGILAQGYGDFDEAERLFRESLSLMTELGVTCGVGRLLAFRLGSLALERGNLARAHILCDEALALFRDTGNPWDIAAILCASADAAAAQGEMQRTAILREQALATVQGLDHPEMLAPLLESVGSVALTSGSWQEACRLFLQSLNLYQMLDRKPGLAVVLRGLASVAYRQGEYSEATGYNQESLRLSREMDHRPGIILCLEGLAFVAAAKGEAEQAAIWLGATKASREGLRLPLNRLSRPEVLRVSSAIRAALGEAQYTRASAAGQAMR